MEKVSDKDGPHYKELEYIYKLSTEELLKLIYEERAPKIISLINQIK